MAAEPQPEQWPSTVPVEQMQSAGGETDTEMFVSERQMRRKRRDCFPSAESAILTQ